MIEYPKVKEPFLSSIFGPKVFSFTVRIVFLLAGSSRAREDTKAMWIWWCRWHQSLETQIRGLFSAKVFFTHRNSVKYIVALGLADDKSTTFNSCESTAAVGCPLLWTLRPEFQAIFLALMLCRRERSFEVRSKKIHDDECPGAWEWGGFVTSWNSSNAVYKKVKTITT